MDNYVMMNARREISKQLSWQQDRRLLWLAAIFNYDNITRKLRETYDVLRLFLKISLRRF